MRRNWQKNFKSRKSYLFYQKARRIDFKRASLLIMFSIVFIFLGWLIFLSPYFEIKNFEIQDSKMVSREKINEIISQATSGKKWNLISGKNFIFFNEELIKSEILRDMPEVQIVTIQRFFPDIIKKDFKFKAIIKIEERKNIGVWCRLKSTEDTNQADKKISKDVRSKETNSLSSIDKLATKEIIRTDNCYFFDTIGIAYKKIDHEIFATDNTFNNLPIVWDEQDKEFEQGKEIASLQFINFLANLPEILYKKTGISIQSIRTPSTVSRELKITTNENWEIYFDISSEPETAVEILNRVLNEKVSADKRKDLEYIDLRIPERIYYKFKGEKKG